MRGHAKGLRADVVFLGSGSIGSHDPSFREAYYRETVAMVHPRLVIPIHWDNFFRPLSEPLSAPPKGFSKLDASFDDLIKRLTADQIQFGVLQGIKSVTLFGSRAVPEPRSGK